MSAGRKGPTVFRVLLFHSEIAAFLGAAALALLGQWFWAAFCAAFVVVAHLIGRTWSRRAPLPMPHLMRWVLRLPRGFHSPGNLKKILQPQIGERILEVGAGVGIHALPTAASLLPGGVLDVFDAQREMLDAIMQRAAKYGITNIRPAQGDARRLPYPDSTFSAAYMIGVLGEIPDPAAALREVRRVLKSGGRLLIGEVLIDPDFIAFRTLRRLAEDTGFSLKGRGGLGFAYMAMFHPIEVV